MQHNETTAHSANIRQTENNKIRIMSQQKIIVNACQKSSMGSCCSSRTGGEGHNHCTAAGTVSSDNTTTTCSNNGLSDHHSNNLRVKVSSHTKAEFSGGGTTTAKCATGTMQPQSPPPAEYQRGGNCRSMERARTPGTTAATSSTTINPVAHYNSEEDGQITPQHHQIESDEEEAGCFSSNSTNKRSPSAKRIAVSSRKRKQQQQSGRGFTRRTSLSDLEALFQHPLGEASRILGVSTTMIKRLCRKYGIKRWPYRQLRSINKSIDQLKTMANTNFHEDQDRLNQQILLLSRKKHLVSQEASGRLNLHDLLFFTPTNNDWEEPDPAFVHQSKNIIGTECSPAMIDPSREPYHHAWNGDIVQNAKMEMQQPLSQYQHIQQGHPLCQHHVQQQLPLSLNDDSNNIMGSSPGYHSSYSSSHFSPSRHQQTSYGNSLDQKHQQCFYCTSTVTSPSLHTPGEILEDHVLHYPDHHMHNSHQPLHMQSVEHQTISEQEDHSTSHHSFAATGPTTTSYTLASSNHNNEKGGILRDKKEDIIPSGHNNPHHQQVPHQTEIGLRKCSTDDLQNGQHLSRRLSSCDEAGNSTLPRNSAKNDGEASAKKCWDDSMDHREQQAHVLLSSQMFLDDTVTTALHQQQHSTVAPSCQPEEPTCQAFVGFELDDNRRQRSPGSHSVMDLQASEQEQEQEVSQGHGKRPEVQVQREQQRQRVESSITYYPPSSSSRQRPANNNSQAVLMNTKPDPNAIVNKMVVSRTEGCHETQQKELLFGSPLWRISKPPAPPGISPVSSESSLLRALEGSEEGGNASDVLNQISFLSSSSSTEDFASLNISGMSRVVSDSESGSDGHAIGGDNTTTATAANLAVNYIGNDGEGINTNTTSNRDGKKDHIT